MNVGKLGVTRTVERNQLPRLDNVVARISALPTPSVAALGSASYRMHCASERLRQNGIVVKGAHSSLSEYAIRCELERDALTWAQHEKEVDNFLWRRPIGRPRPPALRDILIYAHLRSLQAVLPIKAGREIRLSEARKLTAEALDLTCSTRTAKSRRPSLDQVRRAEDRTSYRFRLMTKARGEGHQTLWRADTAFEVLKLAAICLWSVEAERRGDRFDRQIFEEQAALLRSCCRWLDVAEALDRHAAPSAPARLPSA